MLQTDFDTHASDVPVDASGFPAIPAGTTESAPIWDSSRVPAGRFQVDPTVAADTNFNNVPHIKSILLCVRPTGQAITLRLYWRVQGSWIVVNNSGNGESIAAGTTYAKAVPCGGEGTKVTYVTGATPPGAVLISARLRRDAQAIAVP